MYRKAAARIDAAAWGSFSCSTIQVVGGSHKHAAEYAELFKPSVDTGACWGFMWSADEGDWKTRNTCRVIALCFMAAMVEAGDA